MEYVTFEAGKKIYKIRLTINSLCEFEREFNIGVSNALENDKNVFYIRGLLWAGLLAEHSLTMEETGQVMQEYMSDGHALKDVLKLLIDGLKASGFFHTNGKNETILPKAPPTINPMNPTKKGKNKPR